MTRLLVTGGAGFIGANFVHYWLERHPADRVVVLDALTYAGHRVSLAAVEEHPSFRFVRGDVRDREKVVALLADERLDTIVHFAAESHVDRSIAGPEAFIDVNVVGTHSLLQAAREAWLPGDDAVEHRFHHVSTDEVFGSLAPDDRPFTESSLYRPNSPYAASKAAADHLVRAYRKTYGLATTMSNCSNNYGPYQYPEKLIPLCIVNLLHGRELPIYGDGGNVRDWLHVRDHCAGIERILERAAPGACYNLGGDAERDNLTLVRALCGALDELFAARPELADEYPQAPPARGERSDTLLRFVTDRPGHDRRYAIDATRARTELGYAATFDLAGGLADTVRWYVDNPGWWRRVMDAGYRDWVRAQYGDG